jgi:hypothetical protein
MHTINQSKNYKNLSTKFVQYDQSDKVKSFNGSSVSYAAGVTYHKWLLNLSLSLILCKSANFLANQKQHIW